MDVFSRGTEPRDARREGRTSWHAPGTHELTLRTRDLGDVPVEVLRNVSSGGASVVVPRAVSPGTSASILVHAAGARLEFMAQVVWCRSVSADDSSPVHRPTDGSHALGLSLRGPGSFAAMLGLPASVGDVA